MERPSVKFCDSFIENEKKNLELVHPSFAIRYLNHDPDPQNIPSKPYIFCNRKLMI